MKEILILVGLLVVYFYFFQDKKEVKTPETQKDEKTNVTQIIPENAK